MSVIAIGVWLGGLALNIRRTSHIIICSHHGLISCPCAYKDLTMVRSFMGILILDSSNWGSRKLQQVHGTYNPIINSCIFLHTHNGLVNAFGILVVDVVLLLTMLIGLLRDAHRSSIGIWKLLYQQVTQSKCFLHLAPNAELVLVYNLDGAGLFCRDTACGWCISAVWWYSAEVFAGLLFSEFEWCVIFFPHTRAWTEADDALRDLKDAWNQVWIITLWLLLVGD